jgi:hypothetical protein
VEPAQHVAERVGPIAIISDRPIAESSEYRPPTQSQNPNMLSGSMPNAVDLSALVEHGDESGWRPRRSPSEATSHSRGAVRVGQGLERRERLRRR